MYRWDPFGEINAMRDAMDRAMREGYGGARGGALSPPLEVTEDGDAYRVRLALPGVKPEDVHIHMEQNVLTVSGEFRQEQTPPGRRYLHQEHTYGSFSRSISLPGVVDADQATATFEHGILTIALPKREEARPRRIPIGGAGATASQRTIEGQASSSVDQGSITQGGTGAAGANRSTQPPEQRPQSGQAGSPTR